MLNLGGEKSLMTLQMPLVETLHHHQEENRFLVEFQQQLPSRGIFQNLKKIKMICFLFLNYYRSSHFQVYFSIYQNKKQQDLETKIQ